MLENKFQAKLIKKLKNLYPDCIVMKNDPTYIQGIPDLLILHKNKWASLECKKSANARHQPNQDYYVDQMNDMSFSRFVYPENEQQVLDELKHKFEHVNITPLPSVCSRNEFVRPCLLQREKVAREA